MSDDVIDRIEHDHQELEALFVKLESEQGDKAALLRQVADELVPHSKGEEQVVYPAIREAVPREDDEVDDGVAEHKHIEEMLTHLLHEDPEAPGADGMLAAMIAEVRHHVEEEEQDILPAFRKATTQEQRDQLGRRFQQAKDAVPPPSGEATGGSGDSSEDKTRDELYAEAQAAGVEGRSSMSKEALAKALGKS